MTNTLTYPFRLDRNPLDVEPSLVEFRAGKAKGMLDRLQAGRTLDNLDIVWLRARTTGSEDPVDMCNQLIEAWTVVSVAARLEGAKP